MALQGLAPEALLQGLLRVLSPDQLAELVTQLAPAAQGAAVAPASACGAGSGAAEAAHLLQRSPQTTGTPRWRMRS